MKTLIVILCLLSSLTAQTTKKFKNVVIETEDKLMFVNWFRTDTTLLIYETIVNKDENEKTIEDYWWAKKENNLWKSNLPSDIIIYIDKVKTKEDISWMNLPNVSRETKNIGFGYELIFKKFNFWLQEE